MKKLWMLAALFLGFTAISCSDDETTETPEKFEKITCQFTISASDGAREIVSFKGDIVDFNGESDYMVEGINHASPVTFEFDSFDETKATASININATANPNFVADETKKVDAEFAIETSVTVLGDKGTKLGGRTKTTSQNAIGLTCSTEGIASYVGGFPAKLEVKVTKNDAGTYDVEFK